MTVANAYRRLLILGLLLPLVTGCAAFRPVKGVPARYVPDQYRGVSRSGKRTIDLSLLRQTPPAAHRVDSGDLLSIYIEGILGRSAEPLPLYMPQNQEAPPSIGFPIPVREDGTISLPYVGALPIRGLTLLEVEDRIRQAYTVSKEYLNPGRDRMIVALQRPRQYRITVIRQEATSDNAISQGMLNIGMLKRGSGKVVTLPIYRNDVLNALAETGGLPGLDAENAIYVIRNGQQVPLQSQAFPPQVSRSLGNDRDADVLRAQSPAWTAPAVDPQSDYRRQVAPPPPAIPPLTPQPDPASSGYTQPMMPMNSPPGGPQPSQWSPPNLPFQLPPQIAGGFGGSLADRHIIRIPVRLGPGEVTDIREADIVLRDGDIVFIESRDTEVFYTGGMLGGGQYSLPRDYDLDVLGAIAIAQGRSAGGGGGTTATQSVGGQSALNNDVSISASNVIILRPLPDGTQLPIKVDLYEALRDPAERIIIQPGDYVMLQYTKLEAIGAFIERHLLAGALFGVAAAQLQTGSGGK